MTTDWEWERDKNRFVVDATTDGPSRRDHGFPLGPLVQQFATLTYSLLDAESVDDVLQQITRAAVAVVPDAAMVSVTLRSPNGRLHTPAGTSPLAVQLDDLQYELDEGPCYDAAKPDGPAVSICADLGSGSPWRQWGPAAVELGVGAVVSTALLTDPDAKEASGALNAYATAPHGLDAADLDILLLLATHASLAMAGVDAVTRAQLRETQLKRAVDSRDVIGQAKGIIMNRRGVSAPEAFDILRRASQDLNVKLVELAETLATRHTELDVR